MCSATRREDTDRKPTVVHESRHAVIRIEVAEPRMTAIIRATAHDVVLLAFGLDFSYNLLTKAITFLAWFTELDYRISSPSFGKAAFFVASKSSYYYTIGCYFRTVRVRWRYSILLKQIATESFVV